MKTEHNKIQSLKKSVIQSSRTSGFSLWASKSFLLSLTEILAGILGKLSVNYIIEKQNTCMSRPGQEKFQSYMEFKVFPRPNNQIRLASI